LTTALRCQGDNVGAADSEDACILEHLSGMDEEDTTMNVQHPTLASFSAMLFHGIVVPDL
jgi:hypothetical protein